ncbi:hypothetical protein Hanom_Chr16g01424681 [Helianthus anomalus]
MMTPYFIKVTENKAFNRILYRHQTEDHALASTQLKAIGAKKASGIPNEDTKESACGLSSLHSFRTSFLTTAALSVDK